VKYSFDSLFLLTLPTCRACLSASVWNRVETSPVRCYKARVARRATHWMNVSAARHELILLRSNCEQSKLECKISSFFARRSVSKIKPEKYPFLKLLRAYMRSYIQSSAVFTRNFFVLNRVFVLKFVIYHKRISFNPNLALRQIENNVQNP